MIKRLSIKNFIIVENVELQFSDGLQVLTGETGAGKSVIAGAIDLVLGGRLKSEVIFIENESTKIEIDFLLDKIKVTILADEFDLNKDELRDCLNIVREISPSGKSIFYINGRKTTAAFIKEIRSCLIDFHSQRDQQKLFDNLYQLEILDTFAGLNEKKLEFQKLYQSTEEKIKYLSKLKKEEKEKEDRIKLYKYQIEEIEMLKLKDGEDVELENEINLISHAEEIIKLSAAMEQEIYESENSIYDRLNLFIHQLKDFQDDNDRIKKSLEDLTDSLELMGQSVDEIREMQHVIAFDSEHLKRLEDRFDIINRMKSKYRMDIIEIIQYNKEIKKELRDFSGKTALILATETEIKQQLDELKVKADILSKKRKKKSKEFTREIENNIKKMAIPDAKVSFAFMNQNELPEDLELSNFSINGIDEVEIMFTANKGKKMQPLKLAASGGEISRFLLTVKKVMSDSLPQKTIIFDEIDTGIGGKTATLLGDFIHKISERHQVICISHLAQIAAQATKHFALNKVTANEMTSLEIYELDLDEKRKEIARMISGSKSELALKYADEILNKQELAQ